ncbi:MAG: hypothetical protein JRH15_16430 [Deltaproteobacteria bacterium]|nr:hypothetical protein [Deltaproteobacteria bacterium]
MGIGDRFAHQGKAQLSAFVKAKEQGVNVVPVWNKSHREHTIVGTDPHQVRQEADAATQDLDWQGTYFVDADHIKHHNVDLFLDSCDFFTIDIAELIGVQASGDDIDTFVNRFSPYIGILPLPGIESPISISKADIKQFAEQYLAAIKEAGRIYRTITSKIGERRFITEVSLDECDQPQTPSEMFLILAAIANEKIPAQTIAPRFTGAFYKGIDYVGNLEKFSQEFEENMMIIRYATNEFSLPQNLKLSIHSGSDKFSIYGIMRNLMYKYDMGIHLKTAGTTWLEELIGLALSEGEGLTIAKDIYAISLDRLDELCAPYATVVKIDRASLPEKDVVRDWTGKLFADALRHNADCRDYNSDFRQLLHVGYKIAAEMGEGYLSALQKNETVIAVQVEENIYQRHIKKLFFPAQT